MLSSRMTSARAAGLFWCLVCVAALACGGYSTGAADPGAGAIDWSGTWQTNFGPLTLSTDQADPTRVSGRYAYNLQGRVVRGAIEAVASGAELRVSWQDDPGGIGSGQARFVMDANHRAFTGTWGRGGSDSDGGEWNGERD